MQQQGKHAAKSSAAPSAAGRPKKAKRRRGPRILLAVALFLVLVVGVGVGAVFALFLQDLPDYSSAESFNTIKPTQVYASDRKTLLASFQTDNRIPLASLEEAGAYVVVGTVAVEDERFYRHGGVDLIGIGRALLNNLSGGSREGASTITQQLVRNTVLADEMDQITIKRKIREAFLSVKMEGLYAKDDILLMYLNAVNYGSGAYGIEAAARRYFSKPADELSLNEAATLVGIPQSPTYNNPIDNPDRALERRNLVLDRMVSYGAITQAEADAVKIQSITLNPSEVQSDGILRYSFFTSYACSQLEELLGVSQDEAARSGLTVYTSLDVQAQETAEAAAAHGEGSLNDALQVALVAVDPDNGCVRAMVGGNNYSSSQWNLAAQGARQSGSAFKTFTLVASIEQGISPDTQVNCGSSVTIGDWTVSNISGAGYGTRSIAEAFAISSNTAFARLVAAVGTENVIDVAHRMGIDSEIPDEYGLTLGTGDVTTLEMAESYATLANGGTHYEPVVIEQVLDRYGEVLVDNTNPAGERALASEVAHAAVEVMKGVVDHGTGTAAQLSNGQEVAGKTGTSSDYRDSWFCGITPQLSVAVWIGDPENQVAASGDVRAASVFGYFMNQYLAGKPLEVFPDAGEPAYTKTFSNADLDLGIG